MNTFPQVPPGFRFHPTDEELVDYYLRKKVASKRFDLDVIKEVDLYKIEPWDLQELCKIGSEEQNDWYFFSHKDKKYPTGTRTNRATKAGFWKATGRDKGIYMKHSLIGMRKTLVFYKGRAPNGQKSDWIMHEYRLETNENGSTPQEEGWVVCRVFKKRMTTVQRMSDYDWYDDQRRPSFVSPHHHLHHHCKKELDFPYINTNNNNNNVDPFFQLPQLESPKPPFDHHSSPSTLLTHIDHDHDHIDHDDHQQLFGHNNIDQQVTDWRVLDKFVASQLSHVENASKEAVFHINLLPNIDHSIGYASSSTSLSSHIHPWK